MKKTITIISLLLGAVFLAGCSGQQPMSQTQSIVSNPVEQNPTTNQPSIAPAEKKVAADFSCGKSKVKDASGITYGTVLAEDGKCWLDRNLGATEVATSPTDEASYGWYFQWGRGVDGHQIPTSDTTKTFSNTDNPGHAKFIVGLRDWRNSQNDNLWQGVSGKNNPCPVGFRLPTSDEWASFVLAAKIEDPATAFSSSLKLTLAGARSEFDGTFFDQGDGGYVWSSSPFGTQAIDLVFDGTHMTPGSDRDRAYGFSVRCVKN